MGVKLGSGKDLEIFMEIILVFSRKFGSQRMLLKEQLVIVISSLVSLLSLLILKESRNFLKQLSQMLLDAMF